MQLSLYFELICYVVEGESEPQISLSPNEENTKTCDGNKDGCTDFKGIKSRSTHAGRGHELQKRKKIAPPPPSIRPRSPESPPVKRCV